MHHKKWKDGIGMEKDKLLKLIQFLMIPGAALILIIVIAVVDNQESESVVQESRASSSQALKTEEENADEEKTEEEYALEKDAVPEITLLMEKYFKARKTCDPELLNQVYNRHVQPQIQEEMKQRMEEENGYYQDFYDVVCYTKPGLEADSFIIYGSFSVKFRQSLEEVPSMIVCYAKQSGDGNYYLVDELTEQETLYMEKRNQDKDVLQLAEGVNKQLREVLEQDENLLWVYHSLWKNTESHIENQSNTGEIEPASMAEES